MKIEFTGNLQEIVGDIVGFLSSFKGINFKKDAEPDTLAQVPAEEPQEPIKPVISQAQMEENLKNAPVHEEPPQPTFDEVKAAMRKLRDVKGTKALGELLKAYKASTIHDLKPEDYLGARDRALAIIGDTEV